MAAVKTEVECFVLVDPNGDWAVGADADAARQSYADNIGALEECDGFRLVCVKLTVPLPRVVELTGLVPVVEEPGEVVVG
jgi:hypothetical protein